MIIGRLDLGDLGAMCNWSSWLRPQIWAWLSRARSPGMELKIFDSKFLSGFDSLERLLTLLRPTPMHILTSEFGTTPGVPSQLDFRSMRQVCLSMTWPIRDQYLFQDQFEKLRASCRQVFQEKWVEAKH